MVLALLAAAASAHDDGAWPSHPASLAEWSLAGDVLVSAALPDGGSRVALVVTVTDDGPPVALSARGWRAGVASDWVPLEETHRDGELRVMVADLEPGDPRAVAEAVQLRLAAADEPRVAELSWEALVPRFPDAGRRSRETSVVPYAGVTGPLPDELLTIGVVPRSAWGSRATGCSSLEDDWYRMAIHHTAGAQTSGGTVVGALRTTQAYMMDSGSYCDLAYQFMMGFDGSLYEGRPYGYYSGATGGNNDGNAAACFLGCYHPEPACSVAHDETDEMIAGARLLVQTFSRMHAFDTTSDDVRGHRDWPGNSTACPGDYVWERLDEIRADQAWFAATEVDRSADVLVLAPGATGTVEITLRNDGGLAWSPDEVFLGTTGPRDGAAELADGSWAAPNRAATVSDVVAPGEEGTFTFAVVAPADPGVYTLSLGLVAEGITWFADGPWGGGPGDDLLVVTVEVDDEAPAPEPTGDTAVPGPDPDPAGFVPPARVPLERRGCGCGSASAPPWLAILAVLGLRRRAVVP